MLTGSSHGRREVAGEKKGSRQPSFFPWVFEAIQRPPSNTQPPEITETATLINSFWGHHIWEVGLPLSPPPMLFVIRRSGISNERSRPNLTPPAVMQNGGGCTREEKAGKALLQPAAGGMRLCLAAGTLSTKHVIVTFLKIWWFWITQFQNIRKRSVGATWGHFRVMHDVEHDQWKNDHGMTM